ncbi:hypothetical protein GCM10018965_064940 [Nonomuraea roseola]
MRWRRAEPSEEVVEATDQAHCGFPRMFIRPHRQEIETLRGDMAFRLAPNKERLHACDEGFSLGKQIISFASSYVTDHASLGRRPLRGGYRKIGSPFS